MSSDNWESAHNTHWKSFYKSELHARDTREDTRSSAVEASVWKEWNVRVQHGVKESPYWAVQTEQWVVNIY